MKGISSRIRPLVYAVFALVGTVVAGEVALRVYDSCTLGELSQAEAARALETRCHRTHHRLKPLATLAVATAGNGGTAAGAGATHEIRTNSFGVRGAEIEVPKPPGTLRFLLLGDERILGAEVPVDRTAAVQLQSLLQSRTPLKVEVVNAGVPGYCPILSYLQLRHFLAALQPDAVVLNFDMSDVAEDHAFRRDARLGPDGVPLACPHPGLRTQGSRSSKWFDEHFLLPRWTARKLGSWSTSGDSAGDEKDVEAACGGYAWIRDDPPDWTIYVDQALGPIGSLDVLARGLHAHFVLSAAPAPFQVSENVPDAATRARVGVGARQVFRSRHPFARLERFAAERRIPYCDASSTFAAHPQADRLFLAEAVGYSEEGHRVLAEVLAEFLVTRFPGPWQAPGPSVAPPPSGPAAFLPGTDRTGTGVGTPPRERR